MTRLITRYLNDTEVDCLSAAAFASYEMAADWKRAGEAAREYAADNYRVRASDSVVGLAVRKAQVRWEAVRQQVLDR